MQLSFKKSGIRKSVKERKGTGPIIAKLQGVEGLVELSHVYNGIEIALQHIRLKNFL